MQGPAWGLLQIGKPGVQAEHSHAQRQRVQAELQVARACMRSTPQVPCGRAAGQASAYSTLPTASSPLAPSHYLIRPLSTPM